MPKEESWEPEGILRRCTDFSPACLTTSESTFRELDDEFLQAQTRIWLGELLHLRFDVETSLPDLLSDGDLLFQVSWDIWKMLVVTYPEMKYLKAYKNVFRPIVYGKIGSRYLPYSNVDAFLKVCQILGLTAVDLFTPSDVVEKRDVRRVCMCIRALSKRAGSRSLNVPDFDVVTHTIAMPTYVVGCIRKYWEQSRYSTAISTRRSPSASARRYQKRTSDAIHAQQGDLSLEESDITEIRVRTLECESPSSDMSHEPVSPLDPNEEISAVTTLDDLSSFLTQNMGLSSDRQSKEAHDCDSSYSLETLTGCVPEYITNNFPRQFETSPSSSTSSTTVRCKIDSNMGTACSCLTGIRCPIHDIRQGWRKFDVQLALPKSLELASTKTSVEDSSNKSSCSVLSSAASGRGKICHKSSSFKDTQYSEYADDADSCCFQTACRSTSLDLTGFLDGALEDKAHITSSSSCIGQENSDETYSSLPLSYPEANCNKDDVSSVTGIFICKNKSNCILKKETDEGVSGGIDPDASTNSRRSHDLTDLEVNDSSWFNCTADTSDAANPDLRALPNIITETFPIQMVPHFEHVDCMHMFPYQKRMDNIYRLGEEMSTHSAVDIQTELRDRCSHEHEILIHACDCGSSEKEAILPSRTPNPHERQERSADASKGNMSALSDSICAANFGNENKHKCRAKRGDFTEHRLNSIPVNSTNVIIDKCFLANYSEPCSSEVIQDFINHSHTFHKQSTPRQNHVQELFSEPGKLQDVLVSDGTSTFKHTINRFMAHGTSKETIIKSNTISQDELQLNSFEVSSSTYPTARSQLSFDILEKDEPEGASLATPEESTGRVSEWPTEDACHSLIKDVQHIKNTNLRSLYFTDITGDKNLDVSAGEISSNSVEEDMIEESILDIESSLQIQLREKVNVNNCHLDPSIKASMDVICSIGEHGTSIEEKVKTEIVVFNPLVADDSFRVIDVNEFESSLVTDFDVMAECKKIQVNCPLPFLKPLPVLVGAKNTLVLESSCSSSSFRHHSDGGKGCFATSDLRELETSCGCNGHVQKVDNTTFNDNIPLSYVDHSLRAMAEPDVLQLDHLTENEKCSKCTSRPEIAAVEAEEFHNQHKVDKERLSEIRKSKNDENTSSLGMEEGSDNHEMLSVEMQRSGSERNAEGAAKCRPSRKKHLITVAGGVMFVGAFMFLFQLGRKRTNRYGICHKLRAASQTGKPSWTESIKHSLLMWSLGLNFYKDGPSIQLQQLSYQDCPARLGRQGTGRWQHIIWLCCQLPSQIICS